MTKYLAAKEFWKYVNFLHITERKGRSSAAAQLHSMSKHKAAHIDPVGPIIINPNETQQRDVWEIRGEGGVWRRRHHRSRLSLFTPHRVPRGPPKSVRLGMRRRTVGKFEGGEHFSIEDEWHVSEVRHKMLELSWTGCAEFYAEN